MVRISTDDGKSINCKGELGDILRQIEELSPANTNYVWHLNPFITLTQVGMDFEEDDEGRLSINDWEKPAVVFVKHITRIV